MNQYEDVSYINCRRIRKKKRMSLKSLSERSGLSTVYLSNYENGKANITVAALYSIAKALDTSVKNLLATENDDSLFFVPKDERFALSSNSDNPCTVVQEFLTRGSNFDMQVTVMHLHPHTNSGDPKTHDSEEFVFVLEGALDLHYQNKLVSLEKGDLAYYDATREHFWENTTDDPVVFLAVASRKGF
jgi:transcriptional regulator with XRE-family HTH domain